MKVKVKAKCSLKLDFLKKCNKSILHNINTFRKQLFTFSWTTKKWFGSSFLSSSLQLLELTVSLICHTLSSQLHSNCPVLGFGLVTMATRVSLSIRFNQCIAQGHIYQYMSMWALLGHEWLLTFICCLPHLNICPNYCVYSR